MAKELQFPDHYRAHRFADLQFHIKARHRHQVQCTHMLRQIMDKLGKVGTGFHILGNPIEACCCISAANSLYDFREIGIIERTKKALRSFESCLTSAVRNELLKRSKCIAHSALGTVRNKIKRFGLELNALFGTYGAQTSHDRFD